MRSRFAGPCFVALALVAMSCRFPGDHQTTCDDDIDLCPESVTSATSVACDCECTLGIARTPDNGTYEGTVTACLPPSLNVKLASNAELTAMQAMASSDFDQRVFRFCSHTVADFVRSAIRMHGQLPLACAVPVRCTCTTTGARIDSPFCRAQCKDVACSDTACLTPLRTNQTLDLTACGCSRSAACGETVPAIGQAPFCAAPVLGHRPDPPKAR